MDKNKILEIAFNTIKDSTDWGMDCENKNYGFFIDGVVTMTSNLLDEFNKKNFNDVKESCDGNAD